jgi:hypothetical protein
MRVFKPKKEEVTEGLRELHNYDINNLCSSPNIISVQMKEDKMGGACSRQRDEKCVQSFG